MYKFLLFLLIILSTLLVGCNSSDDSACGNYSGKELFKGPEGGCYYLNSNGNKTYVDRSNCNC